MGRWSAYVTERTRRTVWYEVEADTPEEALEKMRAGETIREVKVGKEEVMERIVDGGITMAVGG